MKIFARYPKMGLACYSAETASPQLILKDKH